jgi:integrase
VAKVNFTAARVADFECREGKTQDFLWDSGTPGLGLCVSKSSRAYVFQSRLDAKSLRITIGKTSAWRLPDARAEANRLQVMIDRGIDPRQAKAEQIASHNAAKDEQERTTTRNSITLGHAWPVYLEARKPKWSTGHYQNHVNLAAAGGEHKKRGKGLTVAGPIASLMQLPLTSLTSTKIAEWLEVESARRATNAAQSFRILKAFARWTDDVPAYQGLIPPDAFTSKKVRESVPASAARAGDSLEREQLQSWFHAVRQMPNIVLSTYLQGLLLTGARRSELAALKWADVDLQWNKMTISDKVEGERTIPVTPYFATLLNALPRVNDWVFSSPGSASGHIVAPTKAHQAALANAGLPHVSLHGLRRSFRTISQWVEVPVGVVEQIMGHKPSAIAERHYTRRPIDMLRMWHAKIESWMLTEAKVAWTPSN